MTPYYSRDGITLFVGDNREVVPQLDVQVSAVVTDPPYGLEFMGKEWDKLGDVRKANRGTLTNMVNANGKPKFNTKAPAFDLSVTSSRAMQDWHQLWAEVIRDAMLPGAHLLAFGGTRTWHRLAVAIEDAGLEIRDTLCWLYGSGFPKSLDVSKAIDKRRTDDLRPVCRFLRAAIDAHPTETVKTIAAHFGFDPRMVEHWAARDTDSQPSIAKWEQWLELKALLGFGDDIDAEVWRLNGRKGQPGDAWYDREVIGHNPNGAGNGSVIGLGSPRVMDSEYDITAPATPEAEQWAGWGTALKPSHEPIVCARKPLTGTVASQVLATGTGAINVDGCRIGTTDNLNGGAYAKNGTPRDDGGRSQQYYDTGGASRFFYCAKASRAERNAGLDGMPERIAGSLQARVQEAGEYLDFVHPAPDGIGVWLREHRERAGMSATHLCGLIGAHGAVNHGGAIVNWEREYNRPTPGQWWKLKAALGFDDRYDTVMTETRQVERQLFDQREPTKAFNNHPTVKPLALMRWLLTLVTPPGDAVILDPFAGSGSTLVAAAQLGISAIGVEMSEEYAEIAARRIDHALNERALGKRWDNGTDASRASRGEHMVNGTVTKRTTVSGDERTGKALGMYGAGSSFTPTNHPGGRWPANVLMDQAAADALDAMSGVSTSTGGGGAQRRGHATRNGIYGTFGDRDQPANVGKGDTGGASRFMTVIAPEQLSFLDDERAAD